MRTLSACEIELVSGGCPDEGQEYCWEDIGVGEINMGRLADAAQSYWDWAGSVAQDLEEWWSNMWSEDQCS